MREKDLQKEKKYIELVYSPVTQGYLREYCLDSGFDLTHRFDGNEQKAEEFDFHTTVWFSTSYHSFENGSFPVIVDDIEPKHFSLFGEDNSILVLEIESEKLKRIRDQLGQEHNIEDEWPDFKPHITVCYSWSDDIPQVNLPDGSLIEGTEINIKRQKS